MFVIHGHANTSSISLIDTVDIEVGHSSMSSDEIEDSHGQEGHGSGFELHFERCVFSIVVGLLRVVQRT
jgi:hypothetical protein